MKTRKNRIAIMLSSALLSSLCLPIATSVAAAVEKPTAIVRTQAHSVTYMAGERESLTSARIGAMEKFKREIVDLLPTYVSSVKKLSGSEYTQEIQFLVGSLIEIHSEEYKIDTESGSMKVQLTAKYQFDEKEIERNIDNLKQDQQTKNKISDLLAETREVEGRIAHIRHLYKRSNSEDLASTLDSQIETLTAIQHSKQLSLTIIDSTDIRKQVESARKNKVIEEREAAIQSRLEAEAKHRQRVIASLSQLSHQELVVREAAAVYALAHYEYLQQEIMAPRTLKLVETTKTGASFQIVRIDGKPPLTQWQHSGDKGLARAFDNYPYADFTDNLCSYVVLDHVNNTISKYRYDFKGARELLPVDDYEVTNRHDGRSSSLKGTILQKSQPWYAHSAMYTPPYSDFERRVHPRYSLTAAMPFLIYHVDGERRVHHVDYTQGGKYEFPAYDYRVTIGNKEITQPFFFHRPKGYWSKSDRRIDLGLEDWWKEFIKTKGTSYLRQKNDLVFWTTKDHNNPGEEYANNRNAMQRHMLDPETPPYIHCNDEIITAPKEIFLTNEQLEKTDQIKIDIVRRN